MNAAALAAATRDAVSSAVVSARIDSDHSATQHPDVDAAANSSTLGSIVASTGVGSVPLRILLGTWMP